MSKIAPSIIAIERVEGLFEGSVCRIATTWEDADAILLDWSSTAPRDGRTCHRCDFAIVFEDSLFCGGSYDLRHREIESPDLAGYVRAYVSFLAGTPPRWLAQNSERLQQYQDGRRAFAPETSEAQRWLRTYNLRQA